MNKIIQRGAEAILYLREGERGQELVKERVSKGYRIAQLDARIRKQRTRAEAKLMERAKASGVAVPRVRTENDFSLIMEYIKGKKLKDALNSMDTGERRKICEEMGGLIAALHEAGIIHGDLTTSNMILSDADKKVYLIDFGLGKFSASVEDQAVDLFLLYEALKSTHFAFLEECWNSVTEAYAGRFAGAKDVLARMEKIKKRRRYK
jgi:Kae1-associated kinase Bud32